MSVLQIFNPILGGQNLAGLLTEEIKDAIPLVLGQNLRSVQIGNFKSALASPDDALDAILDRDAEMIKIIIADVTESEKEIVKSGVDPQTARQIALKEAEAIYKVKRAIQDQLFRPEELLKIGIKSKAIGISDADINSILKSVL